MRGTLESRNFEPLRPPVQGILSSEGTKKEQERSTFLDPEIFGKIAEDEVIEILSRSGKHRVRRATIFEDKNRKVDIWIYDQNQALKVGIQFTIGVSKEVRENKIQSLRQFSEAWPDRNTDLLYYTQSAEPVPRIIISVEPNLAQAHHASPHDSKIARAYLKNFFESGEQSIIYKIIYEGEGKEHRNKDLMLFWLNEMGGFAYEFPGRSAAEKQEDIQWFEERRDNLIARVKKERQAKHGLSPAVLH